MSNTQVGAIYGRIIDDVVENCAVIFEEDGVEKKLLDELAQTWRTKLSDRRVANMPWDAPPAAPAAASSGQTSITSMPSVKSDPRVKQEMSIPTDLLNLPAANGVQTTYHQGTAMQRAGQALQERFGSAANVQISQLNAQAEAAANAVAPKQEPRSLPGDPIKLTPPKPTEGQQRQMYQAKQLSDLEAAQRSTATVGNSQTDGADDWQAMVSERRAAAAVEGFSDTHPTLRQLVDQSAQRMEAGGVLRPLSQHNFSQPQLKTSATSSSSARPQTDGADDDDEPDEDAINSDLDDPDDNVVEEEDDDSGGGELMLCTYDKVQRVKNKWKCTLKDGILTTGGKEYVFHKAQGEFEW